MDSILAGYTVSDDQDAAHTGWKIRLDDVTFSQAMGSFEAGHVFDEVTYNLMSGKMKLYMFERDSSSSNPFFCERRVVHRAKFALKPL